MRISDWSSDVCSSDLRKISVTAVDRLARDPFSYYANQMLGLSALDPLSAAPDPRWRGTRIHKLFEDWVRGGATREGFETELAALAADPDRKSTRLNSSH